MGNVRDAILNVQDRKVEKIEVPEWPGVDVYIHQFSAARREKLERYLLKEDDDKTLRAFTAACGLCDEGGTPLFDPDNAEDLDALNEKSAAALQRITDAVIRINALEGDEIEELEKN